MNKEQALKMKGQTLRIRPTAIRMTETGSRLPQEDDGWILLDVVGSVLKIKNKRTDHSWDLGIDNVREYRSPDFLLLRCQLTLKGQEVISEPIVTANVERNISGFEVLLKHSWVHEFIGSRELWISEVDSMFQIEMGESGDQFIEEWSQRFPDSNGAHQFPVRLCVYGVEIKQLNFVSCDGGRISVPLPKIRMNGKKREFYYVRDSLEYRVAQIVGSFYSHNTLENVAGYAHIAIE